MTKLDQLSDFERGEILGFIAGWMEGAPTDRDGRLHLAQMQFDVRDQFPAISDEATYAEAVREASVRIRARGERMVADGNALEQLGAAVRKQQSN